MVNEKAVKKLKHDIIDQGYATVRGDKWYFTTGFGSKNMSDLIAPATLPFSVFQTIASKYAAQEIQPVGKFFLTEFMVETESMGKEPSRFEILEASAKASVMFNEQLTSGLMVERFKHFNVVTGPDDDNRLFGEKDSRFTSSSEDMLLDIIFKLHEAKALKEVKDKEHRVHAEKVLSKTPTPRNKRRKSNKKPR